MSYELKGLNVMRDGAKVAAVNPETGELDFLEGCDNYRTPAVKMLRELDMWDSENTRIPVEKLEIKVPDLEIKPKASESAELEAEEIIKAAWDKAEEIISGAQVKAEEIISGAQSEAERMVNEAREKSAVKVPDQETGAIAPAEINSVQQLVAAMQPRVKEKCPPMHPRYGDKTPEVIAWIQKHDDIRREVLNSK